MNRSSHSHPDLRQALIDAGIAMLSEGQQLTLRGAAQRAGVSHAAPAYYFDGVNGLKTAIAAEGLHRFATTLSNSQDNPRRDAFGNLVAISAAYCRFAEDSAALFHLMFVAPEVTREDPEVAAATLIAYEQLHKVSAPFVSDPSQAWLVENTIWSMTHGYALLQMWNPLRNELAPLRPPPLADQFRLMLNEDGKFC